MFLYPKCLDLIWTTKRCQTIIFCISSNIFLSFALTHGHHLAWEQGFSLNCSPFLAVNSCYSSTGFWFCMMQMRSLGPAHPSISSAHPNLCSVICVYFFFPPAILFVYLWGPDRMPHAPARLLCPWNCLGKNTGLGSHFLFQGIFPT